MLGIIQTIWFISITYPLNPILKFFNSLPIKNIPTNYIALGFSVVTGFVFLFILMYGLFAISSYNDLSFKSENGKLKISKTSIEKILMNKIKENSSLHDIDVKVKLLGKKHAAKTTISAKSSRNSNLTQQGEQVKRLVAEQLHNDLGIPVKKTIVNLSPNVQDNTTRVI